MKYTISPKEKLFRPLDVKITLETIVDLELLYNMIDRDSPFHYLHGHLGELYCKCKD